MTTTNTTIKALPKGEFFKRSESTSIVYVKGEYCRISKGWLCHKFNDINAVSTMKACKQVFAGFTF
jgi:hypothetical protein